MRLALALLTTLLIVASAGSAMARTAPASALSGSRDELTQALAEPSGVEYEILVVQGMAEADRTAHLDRLLAEQGWPEPQTLLLVVYPEANHDIRFAMGAGFRRARVTVEEMLDYLHRYYFPAVRQGDPSGGLASLIRAVNRRMDPVREPLAWLSVTSADPAGQGSIYHREPELPSHRTEQWETKSLEEAREYLGHGVALPPELDGRPMLLYRTYDEAGRLVVTGLSEPETGFWARYRPAGDHRVTAVHDGTPEIERSALGGRPALIVTVRDPGGEKGIVEVWLEEGCWAYEIRGYLHERERVLSLAASMESEP